ncbi:MAG TPA: methylated-DNA--[protein]-cysteine S-methyltransferase [Methylophilaceae bacterium]|nr:methylated-DNA--[protein]-cysteine S-methyltransferase [Methylophilaceae bacterium]
MRKDYQAVIAAPFGTLGILSEAGLLFGIDFLPASLPLQAPVDPATLDTCGKLQAYLRDASAPLDLSLHLAGTEFQRRVWDAIRAIPPGCTLTYSELAQRVGSGARAVANACGANPIPLVIPCHRVVAKHGLGGFMQGREAGSLSIKQWLLQHERSESGTA